MKKFFLLILALAIWLPGCSSKERRHCDQVELQPIGAEYALVSFVRGSHREMVSLWHDDRFVGFLPPESILQLKVAPGKHLFGANSGRRCDFLEVELQGGKHYIVSIQQYRLAGARFMPMSGEGNVAETVSWFQEYVPVNTKAYMLQYYQDKREAAIKSFIDDYRAKYGLKKVRVISGESTLPY